MIVTSAKDTGESIPVGAQRCWNYLKAPSCPSCSPSPCNEEHGDYFKALETLKGKYGSIVCPVTIPTSDGTGVIDLVHNVAYITKGGKTEKGAVPAADADHVEELRAELMEAAAGATEELMEKFFETMELEEADIVEGLKAGMKDRSVVPVFASDAMTNVGTVAMLQGIADYCHAPVEKNDGVTGFVFKTVSDKFGKFSFVKVVSGKITAGMSLYNLRASSNDKLGRMYTMCGKKSTEVTEACLRRYRRHRQDGLEDRRHRDRQQERHRVASDRNPRTLLLHGYLPQDQGSGRQGRRGSCKAQRGGHLLHFVNNAETHQMVVSGAGDIQIGVLCSKLKNLYNVETELKPARVAYREKIKGKVEAHGRHKKQSGGSGQFGDVWIRFEPQDEQDDMIFAEEVFGGSVPKNFFPSVEKGPAQRGRQGRSRRIPAGRPEGYSVRWLLPSR